MFARYLLPFAALFAALALGSFAAGVANPPRSVCGSMPRNMRDVAASGWDVWSEYTPASGACEWMARKGTRSERYSRAVAACSANRAYTRALRAQCVADFMTSVQGR